MAAITERLSRLKFRLNLAYRLNIYKKRWNTYFGSVRFFKHLILTVLLVLLIAPWFFVAYLAVKNSEAEKTIQYTEQMLEAKLMSISNEDLTERGTLYRMTYRLKCLIIRISTLTFMRHRHWI